MPRNQSQPQPTFRSPRSPAPIPIVAAQRPGFFSNMWQGFGIGTGMNIANNLFGPTPKTVVVERERPATEPFLPPKPKEYVQCMKDNQDDKELCEQFLGK